MDLGEAPKKVNLEFSQKSKQIYSNFDSKTKSFYSFHGVQLAGSAYPMWLVEALYKKLSTSTNDIGEYLQIVDNQEQESYQVRSKKDMPAESNVFIVDHALTFRYPDLRRLLNENTSLISRLTEMLKYHKNNKKILSQQEQNKQKQEPKAIQSSVNFTQIQFDNMELNQLSHLQFPNNTVTLSLVSNNLTSEEQLFKKLQYLELKILWVNGNPIEDSETLADYVENKTRIQMFNSKFTKHCTEWVIKYVQNKNLNFAYHESNKNIYKLNLDDRNIFIVQNIVQLLQKFPNLTQLSLKGHQIQQQSQKQTILQILQQNKNLKHLKLDFQSELTLFQLFKSNKISKQTATRIMINNHSLFSPQPTQTDLQIDQIQNSLFKIAGCYRLASTQQLDQTSIWYVNDQVGSAIEHADEGNVKMMPFLYSEDNKMGENMWAYSIVWPIKDIKEGEFLKRDFLHGFTEDKQRSSRLAIWYQLPFNYFNNKYEKYEKNMKQLEKQSANKIIQFYKQNTQKQKQQIQKLASQQRLYPESLTVITDNPSIQQNLHHKNLKLVKNMNEADIAWLISALDEQTWPVYKQKYFINQFPFQSSVVLKHYLADTVQSVLGNTNFLMRTYDLEKQLPEVVGDFYRREQKGEDNYWILKPPNMARSMDMVITNNLSVMIKNMQTGPKIAQKYITRPVLRQGRKVDLRYILLVKSINPLTMFLYKHFWIRSGNNQYTVDCRYLSTYETQFTVMNYGQVSDFKQIKYKDFINQFEKDYAPVQWSQINQKIKKMLRNTFIAAGTKYPQMQNDKSRAMYGIDIMIDSENMEPKLLEITFSPDCKRACSYYPEFFDEVFETLFLDVIGENMERVI